LSAVRRLNRAQTQAWVIWRGEPQTIFVTKYFSGGGAAMEQAIDREQLLAKAMALENKLHHQHREHGYQLSKSDVQDLDNLIQRALAHADPDALRQIVAIRVAHEIHGKVSYEQMKLLKEATGGEYFKDYCL
jgi:hypothetical protein